MIQEEELRKEGGKYAHLNEQLHVHIEALAHPEEAYYRLSHALHELSKYLVPVGVDTWAASYQR
jgi:KH domain-containing, RNA-binding, signal transduction-associated protein 2